VPYYTAKSGILGLTQAQALELAPHVLVNAIAPGPILPPKKITNEEVRNVKQSRRSAVGEGALEISKPFFFSVRPISSQASAFAWNGGRHLY